MVAVRASGQIDEVVLLKKAGHSLLVNFFEFLLERGKVDKDDATPFLVSRDLSLCDQDCVPVIP